MQSADYVAIMLYLLLMLGIGAWSYRQVGSSKDFFVAGGRMPWWLSGISHHMSGYSAVVFTAFAGVAYTYGITLYIWWAVAIAIGMFVGAIFVTPKWARLRMRLNVESPLEYLRIRYNLPTQQILAWSGVLLNIISDGAKWAGMGIVLSVLTGLPISTAILISGGVGMFYITVGGLWADALTDFAQFIVQAVAGVAMFVIVLGELGGIGQITGMWSRLPSGNTDPFRAPYTLAFVLPYILINFLSYTGGTWNLAQRFIASPQGSSARKAALLSATIYLLWPLILFFPLWAAPLLVPNLSDPETAYAVMIKRFLPPGLVGLVLASVFAHTMAITTSDANVVSSVTTRDILPTISARFRRVSPKVRLTVARISTMTFSLLALVIALQADALGGILSLILEWYGGLLGPIAIPMIFGLMPVFRHSDSSAALASVAGGVVTFAIAKYALGGDLVPTVTWPVIASTILYVGIGWLKRSATPPTEVDELLDSLKQDGVTTSEVVRGATA